MDLGSRLAVRLAAVTARPDLPADLSLDALDWVIWAAGIFTLKKLECLKQAFRPDNGAWNNRIGPRFSESEVMIILILKRHLTYF